MATKVNPVTGALDYYEQALPSFRNKVINGNFDIWQRGTSQTNSGFGSVDRWHNEHNGSSKTASQQAFTNGQTDVPNNPKYYLRNVVTSSANAANYVIVYQNIEGVETLAGKTVTLSFYAKADSNKNIATELVQFFGTGGSPSSFNSAINVTTHSLTSSWQKFTVTTTLSSISGKTIGSDNNDSLGVNFWLEAGANFNARTNSLGQQSGTFDIAQVQIEEGASATPFEQRPIGTELSLCQRYYFSSSFKFGGRVTTGSGNRETISFPNTMRAAASVSLSSESKANVGTTFVEVQTKDNFTVYFLGSISTDASTYSANYAASSEL